MKTNHKIIRTDNGVEFILGKRFGVGQYGEVFAAKKLTEVLSYEHERPFAIKLLTQEKFNDKELMESYRNMHLQEFNMFNDFNKDKRLLGHVPIVYDLVGVAEEGKRSGIVMEQLSNQSFDIVKSYLKQNLGILIEIAKTLEGLHKIGWMHRDVAEKNVLFRERCDPAITKARTVLADGGFACRANKSERHNFDNTKMVGTPMYMDLDAIMADPTESSDVFALAVITEYKIAHGRLYGDAREAIDSKLALNKKHIPTKRSMAIPGLDRLLSSTITPRPYGRPTAGQFAEGLEASYKQLYGVAYVPENKR